MGAALACCAAPMCSCLTSMCSSLACCSCGMLFRSLAKYTRAILFCILLSTFLLAVLLGKYAPEKFNGYYSNFAGVDLTKNCYPGSEELIHDCIYRQLIYRASLSLFILFSILTMLAISDFWNKNFLMLKFFIAIAIFIGFWWGDNVDFSRWAEIARVISFLWLLVQGLVFLDFSHDVHDVIMSQLSDSNESKNKIVYSQYLVSALTCLVAAIVGLVYLFRDYTGCRLGMFFTVLTLIIGSLSAFVSILEVVNKGILTPLLMFAYSVFMCWYALLSNPDPLCNPTASSNNSQAKTCSVVVVCIITLTVVMYVVVFGDTILNIFNPDGQGAMQSQSPTTQRVGAYQNVVEEQPTAEVQVAASTNNPSSGTRAQGDESAPEDELDASGTLHERVLFNVCMTLLSCYCAMILTGWGRTSGAPDDARFGASVAPTESMWLKIISQWLFMIMQIKALQVAYTDQNNL